MKKEQLLKEEYRCIAQQFIEKAKKKDKIICAIITGSYYSNRLKADSDIDIFLITCKDSNKREKGIVRINGVKVSYFINPYWKIKELLNNEKNKMKRPTAETVYFSECIFGEKNAEKLKKMAKATITSLVPKTSRLELAYLGWKLYDKKSVLKKKNQDQLNKKYLKYELFDFIISTFLTIKRSYKPHAKYVLCKIKSLDRKFYNKTKKFLISDCDYDLLDMANYVSELLKFHEEEYFKRTKAN